LDCLALSVLSLLSLHDALPISEVDLDALRHNLEQFKTALGPDISIMAVVKANAYGHGAVKVAEEALRSGVAYLAVAFLDEALERSEEHTSELQSRENLVCRLLL